MPVGLGWSLNVGGMVSRTIYGTKDEDTWGKDGLRQQMKRRMHVWI
ncbi:hypothetical protein [Marinifilum fragile]|nr:hypothetical protein [Marinifilum fragile]